MAQHGLPFRLEQHYINGFYQRVLAFVFLIIFRRKGYKVAHADAVTVFQDFPVVIAHVVTNDVDDTGYAAGRRPHPKHIVVAPLHVHRVVLHQPVHNFMGVRTAVINVAHNMQMIHRQPFDQIGQRINEGTEAAGLPDGIQNFGMIHIPVLIFVRLGMEQFVQHITEIFRHGLTYFGTGVLGRQKPRQPQQAAQGRFGPGLRHQPHFNQHIQFLFGIINQCTKVLAVPVIHALGKKHVHFFPDDAGAVVQNVVKGFVLPVQVAHEMFRALGQIDDGLQVDDLRDRRLLGGKLPRQQFQIFSVFLSLVLQCHNTSTHLSQKRFAPYLLVSVIYFSPFPNAVTRFARRSSTVPGLMGCGLYFSLSYDLMVFRFSSCTAPFSMYAVLLS